MLNVVEFPQQCKVSDIAAMARKFADDLEAGAYGEPRNALVMLDGDSLELFNWGEGLTFQESIGALEVAKASIVRRVLGADDD